MSQLRPAAVLLLLLTLVTGLIYPLLTTSIAQGIFPAKANGSLIEEAGHIRGSALTGQAFSRTDYFWGRPSATADAPYNPLASSGSNLAGSNPALDEAIKQRVALLRAANPQTSAAIPVDLVTASASGLDPHISPEAAFWQVPRVAAARQLAPEEVKQLIEAHIETPFPAFLGEPGVNVLALNRALDALK